MHEDEAFHWKRANAATFVHRCEFTGEYQSGVTDRQDVNDPAQVFLSQVLLGLLHLHCAHVIHRDSGEPTEHLVPSDD